MAYLNKVMLIGNVGKDPVIVVTPSNRKKGSFSLATSRRYRDNNGEQREQTEWHNIVAWGKAVDIIEQLAVKKGTTLYVEGSLTNRSWTDQNGQNRNITEVNMESFQLLTPRNSNGIRYQENSNNQQANNDVPVYDDAAAAEEADGLPF